jgi:hypothetical protein
MNNQSLAIAMALGLAACGEVKAPSDETSTVSVDALGLQDGRVRGPTDASRDTVHAVPAMAIEVYAADKLRSIAAAPADGGAIGHATGEHRSMRLIQVRRITNGQPEIHEQWTDVTLVQSGRATLITGGRVTGNRLKKPGEWRGGTITGGASRVLTTGNLIIIPAGIVHRYLVTPGDSIRYVTMKLPQPR